MGNCIRTPQIHYIAHQPPRNQTEFQQNINHPVTTIPTVAPRTPNGPTNDICFQHIIEAVYDACLKAQTNVQMNHLHQFFWFFPKEEGSDSHVARTLKLKIPQADGAIQELDVPYFNLINQTHLSIHEIKLKTKLDMEMTVMPDTSQIHESLPNNTYYRIDLIPGDKSTDLELTLKIDKPPEAIQRILHKFDARL